MKKSKIIILCPHPDDEIFTFPFINNLSKDEHEISALFFTGSVIRRKEAKRSCERLGWQSLFALDFGLVLQDSFLHKQNKELSDLIKLVFDNYQLVLSPALEGGHHDHDTISLLSICIALQENTEKVYFYPTYTAWGNLGFFSVMSENNYSNNIFIKKSSNSRFLVFTSLFHMFAIYRSQLRSWLLLLIPYLMNILKKKSFIIYSLKKTKFHSVNDLISSIKGKPLYEIHNRCTGNEWKSYFYNLENFIVFKD